MTMDDFDDIHQSEERPPEVAPGRDPYAGLSAEDALRALEAAADRMKGT